MDALNFSDCQTIIRAFEKGCAYSTDERSVFALTTPFLQDTMMMADASDRLVEQAYSKKIANIDKEIASELDGIQSQISANTSTDQLDKAQQVAGSQIKLPATVNSTNISGSNGVSTVSDSSGDNSVKAWVVDKVKDCIPCSLRSMTEDIKNYQWGSKASAAIDGMGVSLEGYWNSVFERFADLINMFKGWGNYIDICAFLSWLTDFVCIPDLYKILAALSLLMLDISGFLDGFGIDLVLSFVAPLIMPSLQALVSVLTDFILLVMKPIECIIDAIEKLLRKLDISSFRLPSSVTVRVPSWSVQAGSDYWTSDATRDPQQEHELGIQGKFRYPKTADLKETGAWFFNKSIEFRLNDDYARDASSYKKFELPDLSEDIKAIKEAADWTNRLNQSIKTMFGDLVYFLHAAVGRFEKVVRDVLGELTKLLQEYVLGYSLNFGRAAVQKLAIIKLIGIVGTFIKLIQGPDCNEEDASVSSSSYIAQALATSQGYLAYEDDEGNIHLEEPDEAVAEARMVLNPVIQNGAENILSTQDPILNERIVSIVENLTNPVKVTYRCSFDISSATVERYNEWISE